MKGNGGVSRCGLRDCESSRDLMQRSSAGRLQARSRLERVSRGESGKADLPSALIFYRVLVVEGGQAPEGVGVGFLFLG